MTDIPGSLTDIKALWPDNITGDISPQDDRDVLVSLYPWRKNVDIYQFTLSPTGTLIVGSNTINWSASLRRPAGLIVGSLLYIATQGTPEVVTITAISGASMSFTCANTHSAGYTIVSATGGFAEAANVNPGCMLEVTTAHLYTKWNPPATCPGISSSSANTGGNGFIYVHFYTTSVIELNAVGASFRIENCQFFPYDQSMTAGAMIDLQTNGTLVVNNVYIGGGGPKFAYIGIRTGGQGGRVYVNNTLIFADFRALHFENTSFSLDNVQCQSSKLYNTAIAGSCGLYLATISGSNINNFSVSGGAYQYGIFIDAAAGGAYVAEIDINNLYMDTWTDYGIIVSGTGAVHTWKINTFKISNAYSQTSGITGACILLNASATGWQISDGDCQYGKGYGVLIQNSRNINLDNVMIHPQYTDAASIGMLVQGTATLIRVDGGQIGPSTNAGGALPHIGFQSQSAIADLRLNTIVDGDSQANKIILHGDETLVSINCSGIGNVRKTIAAAATITFPVMNDEDCIEITGATAWATAVAGLREGQKIIMVWTDATPGAISQTATMASPGFTPVRYKPYHTMFSNGKLYIG